ncbi:MAG: ATP-dependent helicase [Candidatus Vogelbacteria bacterium]|nr:ATP-dependent helicase [Candidatus Vogelbacteria bacterium]
MAKMDPSTALGASKFKQYYRALNLAQKAAVDAIEGPVMVVAGPGTGKTQILTLRIANILRQTDTAPDSILALTFTTSGAHSIRSRLVEMIGSAGYRVNISTFHSFCNELIHDYPEEFPRVIGSRPATEVDQIRVLEEVIEKAALTLLRPYGEPFYYLFPVLREIERLKKENVSPGELAKLVTMPKEQELALLYRDYEAALRREKLYDFADMIMEAVRALAANPDFLLRLQERYQYILADEHQDANQSQNELLRLLTNFHAEPNLFIVGDEKQAIFQFQGASLDNFNYFKKLYPTAKLINLTRNYRSTQTILDSAHSLLSAGPKLEAKKNEPEAPILLYAFSRPENESQFLAEDIKKRLKVDVAPDEITVLYRDNGDAAPLIESLERAGVPFVVQSDSDIIADVEIQKLLLLLRAIHHFGEADWLYRVLHLDFLNLDNLAIYRLAQFCKVNNVDPYTVLEKKKSVFSDFYQKFKHWQRDSRNLNLTDLFGAVIEESGFTASLLKKPDAAEKVAKLQALYEEMKTLTSRERAYGLNDFMSYLARLEKHGVALNASEPSGFSGVRLMTMHRAKGLEFDYVYIINAYDGHLGGRHRRAAFKLPVRGAAEDDQDSERRLFYVALTRARKQVIITYAEALPSRLVEEIDKKLIKLIKPVEKPVLNLPTKRRPQRLSLEEKAYLNKLFLERGLSVTDLNNYLRCPLQYFFVNLLRLTRVQNKHLMYGTAVHGALKEFFDAYRAEKKWSEKKLGARFKYHLEREPFSERDFVESLKKGERALAGYYQWYKNKWPDNIINEFSIHGIVLTSEIKLKGKIDKLEIAQDGREVRVVDYKTGKPKTRNDIMGLTKSSDGNYHRQLVFYKLLLDQGKYNVVSGLIDFIEPDEKGRYHQEEFALTDDEVNNLKELVLETANNILNLKFFTTGCGKKDCEYCRLRAMTRKVGHF